MGRQDERIIEEFTNLGLGASPVAQRELQVANLANLSDEVNTSQATMRNAAKDRHLPIVPRRGGGSRKPAIAKQIAAPQLPLTALEVGYDANSQQPIFNFQGYNPFVGQSGFRDPGKLAELLRPLAGGLLKGAKIPTLVTDPRAKGALDNLASRLAIDGLSFNQAAPNDFLSSVGSIREFRKAAGAQESYAFQAPVPIVGKGVANLSRKLAQENRASSDLQREALQIESMLRSLVGK